MGKKRVFDEDGDENTNEQSEVQPEEQPETTTTTNKKKEKKPLPPGYTCKACGMKDDHAIYDCPQKIKKLKKETNETNETEGEALSKPTTSNKTTSSSSITPTASVLPIIPKLKSIFLAGLPFDITKEKIIELILEDNPHRPLKDLATKDIILLCFPDNPKRCKGIGYINCSNDEDYERVLSTLNGKKVGKLNLSAQPSDEKKIQQNAQQNAQQNGHGMNHKVNKEPRKPRCYRCGLEHDPATCENPRICYRCRSTEHISSQCPHKKVKA